jgi:DnaJ-class molecular chaperone
MKGNLGDILATIKVETPKTLDDDYKKALEQLAELEKKLVTPRREAWAKKSARHLNSLNADEGVST